MVRMPCAAQTVGPRPEDAVIGGEHNVAGLRCVWSSGKSGDEIDAIGGLIKERSAASVRAADRQGDEQERRHAGGPSRGVRGILRAMFDIWRGGGRNPGICSTPVVRSLRGCQCRPVYAGCGECADEETRRELSNSL